MGVGSVLDRTLSHKVTVLSVPYSQLWTCLAAVKFLGQ